MEVVDEAEDPPLPASLPPPPPPPPETRNEEVRSPSPTLEDLKEQQEKLLRQLEGNTSLEDLREQQQKLLRQLEGTSSPDTTANDSITLITLDDTAELEEEPEAVKATDNEPSQPAPTITTAAPPNFKASFEGTPVLKFSVFDKLPEGSNFKVGVSDVINFENLPDSTGKYEQMKDLLKNVREKMVKLQSED